MKSNGATKALSLTGGVMKKSITKATITNFLKSRNWGHKSQTFKAMVEACNLLLKYKSEEGWTMSELLKRLQHLIPDYRASHATIALKTKGLIDYHRNSKSGGAYIPPDRIKINHSELTKQVTAFMVKEEREAARQKEVQAISLRVQKADQKAAEDAKWSEKVVLATFSENDKKEIIREVATLALEGVYKYRNRVPKFSVVGKPVSHELGYRLILELGYKLEVEG